MYGRIISTNIARRLKELGMTETELASHAGVSMNFLKKLADNTANPTLSVLVKLANALQAQPIPSW